VKIPGRNGRDRAGNVEEKIGQPHSYPNRAKFARSAYVNRRRQQSTEQIIDTTLARLAQLRRGYEDIETEWTWVRLGEVGASKPQTMPTPRGKPREHSGNKRNRGRNDSSRIYCHGS
jgi:hypothetical protein